jgi:hypothetical protein
MSFLRLTGAVILTAGVFLAGQPAAANDLNRGFTIEGYEEFSDPSEWQESQGRRARWYHYGLLAGMQVVKEEYAKAGAVPLFCLPLEIGAIDLHRMMVGELAQGDQTWQRASTATAEQLALYVVRRAYPC